ncbi:MAG TPA: hypothetical protein VL500_02220 [Candidatus Eisenbacteria bacterium]|nr:hypothetical protein [Candidatus Eisenbacteria bacterium]
MVEAEANVLRFPLRTRMRIRAIVERCPAMGAVAARLPEDGDPARDECERMLARAFTLLLHLPDLTREEADAALDHEAGAEETAAEELAWLCQGNEELYAIWREVWADVEDAAVRGFARYAVALIARLYRLECLIRRERAAEAVLSA